jgi:hypothetical protein
MSEPGRHQDLSYVDFHLDVHQLQRSQVTNVQLPADPRRWQVRCSNALKNRDESGPCTDFCRTPRRPRKISPHPGVWPPPLGATAVPPAAPTPSHPLGCDVPVAPPIGGRRTPGCDGSHPGVRPHPPSHPQNLVAPNGRIRCTRRTPLVAPLLRYVAPCRSLSHPVAPCRTPSHPLKDGRNLVAPTRYDVAPGCGRTPKRPWPCPSFLSFAMIFSLGLFCRGRRALHLPSPPSRRLRHGIPPHQMAQLRSADWHHQKALIALVEHRKPRLPPENVDRILFSDSSPPASRLPPPGSRLPAPASLASPESLRGVRCSIVTIRGWHCLDSIMEPGGTARVLALLPSASHFSRLSRETR